ncbi:MAG TPA: hypothetical protein VE969_04895 [Pyrinomonadaceae bacterium]|nr:hypothetical protein [Pyrinomonadaceae bacterium]
MQPKRTKYDTNPLDEKVADRASESFPSQGDAETIRLGGETTRIEGAGTSRARSESEAPTQMIQDKVTSYPSVFVPPPTRRATMYESPGLDPASIYQPPPVPPPNIYQPPPVSAMFRPGRNRVTGLGIQERWANLLPYVPGYIGAVAAVIELLLVPRTEGRTRFHAAQGLGLQIAILILSGAFGILTLISGSNFGSGMFRFAAFVFLIVSMIRAFKGRPHHIAPLDAATRWLEEKIKPRK